MNVADIDPGKRNGYEHISGTWHGYPLESTARLLYPIHLGIKTAHLWLKMSAQL